MISLKTNNMLYLFLDITYSELETAQPFGNTVNLGDIKGQYLQEMFEFTVQENYTGQGLPSMFLMQLSGKYKTVPLYYMKRSTISLLKSVKVQ